MRTRNPGGARPPASARWAYFRNEGYQYKDAGGQTKFISLGRWNQLPATQRERFRALSHAKLVTSNKGGGWYRVGGDRWRALTSQGRTPHGFAKSPYQPGSTQWKSWTNTRNIAQTGAWTPELVRQAQRAGTINSRGAGNTSSLSGNGRSRAARQATQATPNNRTDPNTLWARYAKMLGNPNTNVTEKLSDARHMADLQYGAQINDTKLQQAEGVRQAAQNQKDIQDWFKAAVGVNAAGKKANAEATTQAANADQNSAMALLAAIGGGANHGAGQLAAQMLNDQANVRAQGGIQQDYQNNMDTALASQQIGDMNAQKALDSQQATGLQQALRDLMGQRGNAIVTNQQAIRAANNAARQANYGNRTSQLSSILGALQLQQNLKAGTIQLAGARRQQAQQQHQGAHGPGNGFVPWTAMNASQQHDLAMQLLQGPNGTLAPLAIGVARAKALHYNNPDVFNYLKTVLMH